MNGIFEGVNLEICIQKSLKLKQSNRLLIVAILFPALQHVSMSPPTAFTPR